MQRIGFFRDNIIKRKTRNMKRTTTLLFSFLFMIGFSSNINAQNAADFSLVDVFGNEHNLYEDYLDQGKTVLISFGGAWNPWDSVWISSGVLQEFHTRYSEGDGEAVVMFIDPLGSSIDDLYGNGNNSTGYDFITGNDFPIITTNDSTLIDDYTVNYFPTIRLICPDGSLYSDDLGGMNATSIENLGYGDLETADHIADIMYETCGTEFDGNRLEGRAFQDQNLDCLDNGEKGVPNIMATFTTASGSFVRKSDEDGNFRSLMQQGDYTVHLETPNSLWSICNNDQMVSFAGTDEFKELDFGFQVESYCPHPSLSISTPFFRRCFDTFISVEYCNEGTEVLRGALLNVQLHDFIEVSGANLPYTQTGNLLTFDLGDIDVLDCGRIKIEAFVNCDAPLGEEICYSATITDPCSNGVRTYEFECQEIIGSYDPNDKRAFPLSGTDNYTIKPNENIKYQIRFQNTGNDTAFTVVVEDVMSPLLDLSTFETGASSHPYEIEIDDRTVKFIFNNIMLPDSNVNLVGSNGFLTYYVDQLPDLNNGTEIKNEAGIYFDFNDAVITNVTTHTIDDGIVGINEIKIADFDISPNPANDFINLKIGNDFDQNGSISIYNIIGKKVLNHFYSGQQTTLDINTLENGVYLIKIEDESGNKKTRKLIKE